MSTIFLIFQSSSSQQDSDVWALLKNRKFLEIYHDREMIRDFHRETRHYLVVQIDRLAIRSVEAQNLNKCEIEENFKSDVRL